jgi:protein-S-isoprenylcysteine O-methyltransferase Ste14
MNNSPATRVRLVVLPYPYVFVRTAWAVWLITWFLAAAWSSPAARRPGVQRELGYRLATVAGAVLLFGIDPARDLALWHLGLVPAWTCAALTVGGFLVTWWARVTLGRLWSSGVTRKADHAIITNGPYSFVRHPIYTGLLLAIAATAALRGTAGGCLGALIIAVGLVLKARVEEQFLRVELGEAHYDAYARRVPMLVPFL